MSNSYDAAVIPNNNITKLTSLNNCAKHIIDIARNPKDKNGNTKVVLFDIDDCIMTYGANKCDEKAIYLLELLKNKGIDLGICSTSIAILKSKFLAENRDIKGFCGSIELDDNSRRKMINNINSDANLTGDTKKLYKELFPDDPLNQRMNNNKGVLILKHYVYQKYLKNNNKVDITYLDNDIGNFDDITKNIELGKLIKSGLLTITTIPMSLKDPKRARQPIKDTFTTEALVKEITNIEKSEKLKRTIPRKKKATPLTAQQRSIPKVHFGLNPEYKKDHHILSLYYKGKKSSSAPEEVKEAFDTMLKSLPKPALEGASPEFKKMLASKKATLGTDLGIISPTEQYRFNKFFYGILKKTDQNTNTEVVNKGFCVYR